MRRLLWFATSAALLGPAPLTAQPMASVQRATRADLMAMRAQLEQQVSSGALRGDARVRALANAGAVAERLARGDFRIGDRFVITLLQDSLRSDTASVRDSLKVAVLNLPDVSLAGVLRSELDDHMSGHVARFLRNTTVRTNVLTRVAVLGAVRTPGFYYVSPDRPISDLLMVAGGPSAEANLNELEVLRSQRTLISARDSKRLIKEGRTLEQLDLQSGDEVRIPVKRRVNWGAIVQLMFVATSVLFGFLQFLMWYYNRQEY